MNIHTATCHWTGEMSFRNEVNDHQIIMDAESQFGGQDKGPRPKPLLLTALGGCTGMDVVALLKKMRIDFTGFEIEVSGELTNEHPKYYHKIHIKYDFSGEDIAPKKLEKAVTLSQDRYCGVSYMLKQAASITYEIRLNDETIFEGSAA